MTRAASEQEIAALKTELRSRGLRATLSRAAVLRMLRRSGGPISHTELCESLATEGWDRATLYRNLTDLVKVGLARRADMGDHTWRFEAVTAGHDGAAHPHFVCNQCGTVVCLDDLRVSLPRGSRGPRSLRSNQIEVQVKGACDRCA